MVTFPTAKEARAMSVQQACRRLYLLFENGCFSPNLESMWLKGSLPNNWFVGPIGLAKDRVISRLQAILLWIYGSIAFLTSLTLFILAGFKMIQLSSAAVLILILNGSAGILLLIAGFSLNNKYEDVYENHFTRSKTFLVELCELNDELMSGLPEIQPGRIKSIEGMPQLAKAICIWRARLILLAEAKTKNNAVPFNPEVSIEWQNDREEVEVLREKLKTSRIVFSQFGIELLSDKQAFDTARSQLAQASQATGENVSEQVPVP